MDTRTIIPLHSSSANYREWITSISQTDYCIIEDAGTWTLMEATPLTDVWRDSDISVEDFLATQHLFLEDTPQEEPHMEPMIGYDFRADGRYDTKHYLENQKDLDTFMSTNVVRAFMEGREAMVTDSGDNAVFHVKAGKVEWAGGGDTTAMASTLRAIGVKQNDLKGKLKDALGQAKSRGDRSAGMER